MTEKDVLAAVRPHHWSEIAEHLGQPTLRVRETLRLYLELLDSLGYTLISNSKTTPPRCKPDPLDRLRLYTAIESALYDVTSRRVNGERVSDQDEARCIMDAVESLL